MSGQKHKKIKIVSDGTQLGTKIYDTSGNLIPLVAGVNVLIDGDSPLVKCWLKLVDVELELTTNVAVEEVVKVDEPPVDEPPVGESPASATEDND